MDIYDLNKRVPVPAASKTPEATATSEAPAPSTTDNTTPTPAASEVPAAPASIPAAGDISSEISLPAGFAVWVSVWVNLETAQVSGLPQWQGKCINKRQPLGILLVRCRSYLYFYPPNSHSPPQN